jgi:hypothetical protein
MMLTIPFVEPKCSEQFTEKIGKLYLRITQRQVSSIGNDGKERLLVGSVIIFSLLKKKKYYYAVPQSFGEVKDLMWLRLK